MSEHQPTAENPEGRGETDPAISAQPEREQQPALRPRVWIGSLADYNNGTLTGDWIDAAVEDQELIAAAHKIVAGSETPEAEEWAIFDFDDFAGWHPGEYEDLTVVARVARGIAEHGPAFAAWADIHDADPDMMAAFSDAYLGHYDSPEAWAEQMLEDLGTTDQIQELLEEKVGDMARYVSLDTGGWAQDAWLSGDISIAHDPNGGVWIFDGNP